MVESAIASSTTESKWAKNEAREHKRAEAWRQTTSSLKEMQACAARRRQCGRSFGPPSYAQRRNEVFDFGGIPGVNTQDAEDDHRREHVVTDFVEPSTQHEDQAEWDAM
jgi:hypothetical protein